MLNFFKKKRVRDYLKDEEFLKEYDQLRDEKKKEVMEEKVAVDIEETLPITAKEVEVVSIRDLPPAELQEDSRPISSEISKRTVSVEKVADAASILDIEFNIPEDTEAEEDLDSVPISQEDFDLAAPVRKPFLPKGKRFDISKPILNFAIGYPF